MALVNLLRFNDKMGAIISDEEYWNIYFRRRMYCDNLHSLLDEKQSNIWKMEVSYGAVGSPSLHHEVILETRRELDALYCRQEQGKGEPISLVKDVARIAFEALQKAIRRRIDLRLRYIYGFNTDDLNRGFYEENGVKHPIQSKFIKEDARAIASGDKTTDPAIKAAMACRAAIFGYDTTYGITAYQLSVEKWIMGYVHEGFDCIGTGKYASGLSLGADFKGKTLMMRKAGYTPAEGLLELIASATVADDHFREVGGNMNFVIIDGDGKDHLTRYREIFDDKARLASEIVRGYQADLLDRQETVSLLDGLVFKEEPLKDVQTGFFQKSKDKNALHFLLRGYKLKELEGISLDLAKESTTDGEGRLL